MGHSGSAQRVATATEGDGSTPGDRRRREWPIALATFAGALVLYAIAGLVVYEIIVLAF